MFVTLVAMCGCQGSTEAQADCASGDLEVVKARLLSFDNDLKIWNAYRESHGSMGQFEQAVAVAVVEHIIVIGAAKFSVEQLNGHPLEALCGATTGEARAIIELHPNESLKRIAIAFLDAITPSVRDRVSEIQAGLLGRGCDLSPR